MQFITLAIVTALAGASPVPQAATNKDGLGWTIAGKDSQLRSATDVKNVYADRKVLPLLVSKKSRKLRGGLRAARARGAGKEKEGSESSDADSDSDEEASDTPGAEEINAPGYEEVPGNENLNENANQDDSDSTSDDGGFDNVDTNANAFGEDSEDSDDDNETITNNNVEDNNNVNDANQGVLIEDDEDESDSSSDESDYYVKTDKEASGKSNVGRSYKKRNHSGSGANDADYTRFKGARGYREKTFKSARRSKSIYRKEGDSDSDDNYPGLKRDLSYKGKPYSVVGGKSSSRNTIYYTTGYSRSKGGYPGTGVIKGTKGSRVYGSQSYSVAGGNQAFISNGRARGDSYKKDLDSENDNYSSYKTGLSDARHVYSGLEKRVDSYKGSDKGSGVNGKSRSNAYSSGNKYDY